MNLILIHFIELESAYVNSLTVSSTYLITISLKFAWIQLYSH